MVRRKLALVFGITKALPTLTRYYQCATKEHVASYIEPVVARQLENLQSVLDQKWWNKASGSKVVGQNRG